jgi:hypothetical protein
MTFVFADATEEEAKGKHVYCAIECKQCRRGGVSTLLLLKYLGLSDGRTMYGVPLAPYTLAVSMYCERCGETSNYSRSEIQVIGTDRPPAPDFVEQF